MGYVFGNHTTSNKKRKGYVFGGENELDYATELQNRIANYETRFGAAGEAVPETKKKSNLLLKALDILDKPRELIVKGLTGKEHVSEALPNIQNKYLRGIAGFVGDVALDPFTYLSLGAAGAGKTALKVAGKSVADVTPLTKAVSAGVQKTGVPEMLGPVFSTKYIRRGATSAEELPDVEKARDLIRNLPQTIKGEQAISLNKMKKKWAGVTPEAAKEAPDIIEAPLNYARKTGFKGEIKDTDAAKRLGLNMTPEGQKAATIAKQLTRETAAKDVAAGVEFGKLPNYIKHLYKEEGTAQKLLNEYNKLMGSSMKPNKLASFQKERKYSTYAEFDDFAKEHGYTLTPIKDARILTAVREMEGIYKRASNKMYDGIAKLSSNVVTDAKNAPKGWSTVSGVKQLEGKVVHPEVSRFLDRFNSTMATDDGLRSIAKSVNTVHSLWKSLVTTSIPFHLRNAAGNFYNNWLSGVVNPTTYVMAGAIQRGADDVFRLGGKDYTGQKIYDLFRKQGLEGFGVYQGESLRTLTKEAEEAFSKNMTVNPLKVSRKVGNALETNAKLTHFIDKITKGYTPEQAAESVRKYLFDYSDITTAERKIRNIIPFYTWARKNVPVQLESLITQPGKATSINKLTQNMGSSMQVAEEDTPDWMKSELAIPVLVNKDGTQVYLMPDLPITNLNMFGGGATMKNLAGMLTPLAKVPIEAATGRQIYTGQPIEEYPGATARYGNLNLPAKVAYGLNQLGAIPRSIADVAGSVANQQPPGTSNIPPVPLKNPLLGITLGSMIRPNNPERQRLFNLMDREKQLADYRKYLEEVKGTDVPTLAEIKPSSKKKRKGYVF